MKSYMRRMKRLRGIRFRIAAGKATPADLRYWYKNNMVGVLYDD